MNIISKDYVPTKEKIVGLMKDKDMTIKQVTDQLLEEKSKPTKSVSCRVNSFVRFNYKCETDQHKEVDFFPISSVIEAGMIYFLKLSNKERINFLKENTITNVKMGDLKDLNMPFEDYINSILEENYLPKEVYSKMSMDDKIKTVCNILKSKNK